MSKETQTTENTELFLLGDEAVGLGALHGGLSIAYGYPGTPSTEIMEFLLDHCSHNAGGEDLPHAAWCANEKTAFEAALGVSFAGKRTLVTMKHVGLNVCADPYINSALLGINGGLVLAVADDPGMHSSQDEQDSRFFADFAFAPCLEPQSVQEAYDMTREAFLVSERFHVPVMLRLTTRISHARAMMQTGTAAAQNSLQKPASKSEWISLPANARKNYAALLEKQKEINAWSEAHAVNRIETGGSSGSMAVITSGLGGNYYAENLADFSRIRQETPGHLHIGAYPPPTEKIRRLCVDAKEILVIEEGQPFLERRLRGILDFSKDSGKVIHGKLDGTLPASGELTADIVREALSLPPVKTAKPPADFEIPVRPPQLCKGCPHIDSYTVIKTALSGLDHNDYAINSDIGCYSLGAAGPLSVPESIVCMGASVGMARGAAEAGIRYAIAVIGDSTFVHSGIQPLIDAAAANTPMTLVILDNTIVAMTGCQEPVIPSTALKKLLAGTGVDERHLLFLDAIHTKHDENVAAFKQEMEYRGLSVVVFQRECLEAVRKRRGRTSQPC
jgi:indolepyruvate ferredoxin oxidoreductase alpha subunit